MLSLRATKRSAAISKDEIASPSVRNDNYRNENPYTEEFYLENLRKMSGEKRLTITSELSEVIRELSRCGIRKRNPEFSKQQVEKELWRIIRHDPK